MDYNWINNLKDITKYKFLCVLYENRKLIYTELVNGIPMQIKADGMVITFLNIKDIKKVKNLLLNRSK